MSGTVILRHCLAGKDSDTQVKHPGRLRPRTDSGTGCPSFECVRAVGVWDFHNRTGIGTASTHITLLVTTMTICCFAVRCEAISTSKLTSEPSELHSFYAAGTFFGPRSNRKQLDIGTFRRGNQPEPIEPPFTKFDPWVRVRAAYRDDTCTMFINGRQVHSEQLSKHHDPWFGGRGWVRNFSGVRDVHITGSPWIPDAVVMSASPKLTGWLPYYDEVVGTEASHWHYIEDPDSTGQIVGRHSSWLSGTSCESLLRYHRPLAEDGSVEYDFFYEPGRVHTHPTLDRLVFMLAPSGVRIHWTTDATFDRTNMPPDNMFDEPKNRRGPAWLPLATGAWNHVKLSLLGNTVTIELNGQTVYSRELETTNRRTFGLFHFADKSEVRVRNVIMRGDWPKTLPSIANQELGRHICRNSR